MGKTPKKKPTFPSRSTKLMFTGGLALLTVILFAYLLFLNYYQGRIFPGVAVSSYTLSGRTPAAVHNELTGEFNRRAVTPLAFTFEGQNLTLDLGKAAPQLGINSTIDQAYLLGRSGDPLKDLRDQGKALLFGIKLTPTLTYSHPAPLLYQLSALNQLVKIDPQNARLALGENIILTPAQNGREIDSDMLLKQVESYLTLQSNSPTILPTKISAPKFSDEEAAAAKLALDNIKNAPIQLKSEQGSLTVDQVALFNLLDLSGENPAVVLNSSLPLSTSSALLQSGNLRTSQVLVSKDKLTAFLDSLLRKINRPAKDARFVFDPGAKRVSQFQAAQEGREVDLDQVALLLAQAAGSGSPSEIDLPVKVTKPTVTASDADSFGIKDLLGEGFSRFAGSIDNRIFNIGLAASRLSGVLIAPGEVFSFNNTVGDISAASGYKQAYVIKEGRTVLDDGGGVCQVSTTLFRALLNAGLPITARTAHAYRVGYYEQGFPPGLDATVFAPSVDLKFKNDTPSYLLIQANSAGTSLTIDVYGTSDGRVSALSTPVVADQTPPPPELRQDDPTLPRGTVKQVDWSAWGANVSFKRTVTRNGETLLSESWRSNYRPWQAIFLVGTKD